MQRRTFLGWIGAGAAVGALGGSIAPRASTSFTSAAPTIDAAFTSVVGRPLAAGYRVDAVSPIEHGVVTLWLARDGVREAVRVFRRSSMGAPGLARTAWLDLRLMNGADGASSTREGIGLAVMTLAARLRRVESVELARALVTHDAHRAIHGGYAPASPT